jgi:hypothetical protein
MKKSIKWIGILAAVISLPSCYTFTVFCGGNAPPLWSLFYLPHQFATLFTATLFSPWIFESPFWFNIVFVYISGLPVSILYAAIIYGLVVLACSIGGASQESVTPISPAISVASRNC